jgi:hypothetical protein
MVELIFCCVLLVFFAARYGRPYKRPVNAEKLLPDG